ncbi:MAG: NADH-quinone oxidoreductase subunit NuoE [Candidatus Tectomicrobia bacterium]|uniref:NADH-quinone oxidoreductase subunit NuoE n=1 Tax=Tectimicrobiota bacterium TaxID=2528274 RepID=A0A932FVC5_UNCTE|nr:NADH-quinone oxidoreductase subunit NuoE [Candidatus Tectomicrobia bacterium]
MLSDAERREIEGFLAIYPTKQTASVDGLMVIQRHRGWVSDEALKELAPLLEMTPDELDGVATFYSRIFRRPVGKHIISVCDSISCYILGGETLLTYLEKKLGIQAGQTTPDGTFTLIPTVCLGHCELAPVMLVDRQVFGHLTEEKIDRILAEVAKISERL